MSTTRLLSEKLASEEITDINKAQATALTDASVLNRGEVDTRIAAKMADGTIPTFFKGGTDPGDALLSLDEVQAEVGVGAETRMRWMGTWQQATTYEQFDVVTDATWLMIANKQTTERAAPQSVGDKKNEFLQPPVFVDASFTGEVVTGHQYDFLKTGWVEAIEIYVPEVSGEIEYDLYMVDNVDPLNPLTTKIPISGMLEKQWYKAAVGSLGVNNTSTLSVLLSAINKASTSQFTGQWDFSSDANNVYPTAGQWNRDINRTQLRISVTDGNSANRLAELMSVVPGSTITLRSQNTPTTQATYGVTAAPVDNTTYVEYAITLDSQTGVMPDAEPCDLTFTVAVAGVTKYSEDQDHWAAQGQPDFCVVSGYHTEDGVTVPLSQNHAYGVRITFQEASLSDDWDILSAPERSGGSAAGNVMAYFYDKQSAVTVTATNPAWQEIAQISYNQAPPGVYEYRMSLSYNLNSTTTSAYFRFSIDGGNTWSTFQAEPKDITDTRPHYYSFPKEYANITDLDLILEMSKEVAGDTLVVEFVDAIIAQQR